MALTWQYVPSGAAALARLQVSVAIESYRDGGPLIFQPALDSPFPSCPLVYITWRGRLRGARLEAIARLIDNVRRITEQCVVTVSVRTISFSFFHAYDSCVPVHEVRRWRRMFVEFEWVCEVPGMTERVWV